MDKNTVLLFTRNGMGAAPQDLQQQLAVKFLSLIQQSGEVPAKILFYTNGVRLACRGSLVVELLRALQAQGVELVLCKTCLDYFRLTDEVEVGVVGGMPDIIEAMQSAGKVISL